MAATTTFVKCGTILGNNGQSNNSDPLLWDCQQFPDSNTKFSPIKQEIMDTYDISMPHSDFTELKPMPFDYGSSLTGIDPVLSNNNIIILVIITTTTWSGKLWTSTLTFISSP